MSAELPLTTPALRVGLVGANWGLTHLDAWRAVPGAMVTAICTGHRESAERVAAEHGIPTAYWNATDLLADPEVDVVDVTVRPAVRATIVPAALRAGKHILQPLPFAADDGTARELHVLAQELDLVAVVENLHRHEPALRQFRDLVRSGTLGRVHTVRGHVRSNLFIDPPDPWPYEWVLDPTNHASALRNFGAHLLHAIIDVVGPVASVAAALRRDTARVGFVGGRRADNGVIDNAALLLRMASGAGAVLDVSWCAPAAEGFGIEAVGDQGRARVTADRLGPQHARLEAASRPDAEMTPVAVEQRYRTIPGIPGLGPDPEQPRLFPMVAMCKGVCGAGPERAMPTFAEAAHVSAVVESAYAAHERETWIPVPALRATGHGPHSRPS
jgi:predicted dehydrogenase